jgi:acylphosphatase
MMADHAVHVVISGRVQGVGYRAWTARRAGALGLRGWVRNRRDGTVEAVFAGAERVVAAMVEECRQGPRAAKVADVTVDAWTGPAALDGFEEMPTA